MTFSVLFHSEVLADLARFLRSNQKKKKSNFLLLG